MLKSTMKRGMIYMGKLTKQVSQRLIPLPKEVFCNEERRVLLGEVEIDFTFSKDPHSKNAESKLRDFFGNSSNGSFKIKVAIPEEKIERRLKTFKNPDQAYAIWFENCLNISALTSIGLLNGVRTLLQAVEKQEDAFLIPLLFVYDYPDMPYRGQWGGNSMYDIENTSLYKLNSLDYTASFETREDGIVHAFLKDADVINNCISEGVSLSAYIPHFEGIIGLHLDDVKDKEIIDKIKNVPTQESAQRNDYKPGLCMSSVHTHDLVYTWMKDLASIQGVNNVMVWLSEAVEPCICSKCKGQEPFLLETKMLVDLFKRLKEEFPHINSEILLTQGSYSVNKEILELVPKDIGVLYYHGSRTYISDKKPMIYEDLLPFIEKGGKLGVYPQITHGWRCVFPWTGPDFIKYRCDEFVEKGLDKVVGYAVPSNIYHRFNIAAMAEWLWNNKGRDIEAFCQAYAYRNNLDPEVFSSWCLLNMESAWILADNRFVVSQIFNYPVIMKTDFDSEDFRFTDYTRRSIVSIEKYIRRTEKAVKEAKLLSDPLYEYESKSIKYMLRCAGAYQKFFTLLKLEKRDQEKEKQLVLMYEKMRDNALKAYKTILLWKVTVEERNADAKTDSANLHFSTRSIDTATVCLRIADFMEEVLVKLKLNYEKKDHISYKALGSWTSADFDESGLATLTYDLEDFLKGSKRCHLCLDYLDSAVGTDLVDLAVLEGQKVISHITYDLDKPIKRINIHNPWYEVILDLNEKDKSSNKILKITLAGPIDKNTSCKGLVGIRRIKK